MPLLQVHEAVAWGQEGADKHMRTHVQHACGTGASSCTLPGAAWQPQLLYKCCPHDAATLPLRLVHAYCRQKVIGEKTYCPCGDASGIWCGNCLDIRMGENLDEVCVGKCCTQRNSRHSV